MAEAMIIHAVIEMRAVSRLSVSRRLLDCLSIFYRRFINQPPDVLEREVLAEGDPDVFPLVAHLLHHGDEDARRVGAGRLYDAEPRDDLHDLVASLLLIARQLLVGEVAPCERHILFCVLMVYPRAREHHLRVGQYHLDSVALLAYVLLRKVAEVDVGFYRRVQRESYLALAQREVDAEILVHERAFQFLRVIVRDDFVELVFGRVEARAPLYLHHHHGNGVEGRGVWLCLPSRAGGQQYDEQGEV